MEAAKPRSRASPLAFGGHRVSTRCRWASFRRAAEGAGFNYAALGYDPLSSPGCRMVSHPFGCQRKRASKAVFNRFRAVKGANLFAPAKGSNLIGFEPRQQSLAGGPVRAERGRWVPSLLKPALRRERTHTGYYHGPPRAKDVREDYPRPRGSGRDPRQDRRHRLPVSQRKVSVFQRRKGLFQCDIRTAETEMNLAPVSVRSFRYLAARIELADQKSLQTRPICAILMN